MKKVIIILGVLMLIALAILAIISIKKTPQAQNTNPQPTIAVFKPLPTPSIPAGDTVFLKTASGQVQVSNFFSKATKIIEDSVFLADQTNYSIIYSNTTNEFSIALLARTAADANSYRLAAESNLKSLLNLNQNDLCQLTVHVGVPISYNADLAGTDYHLSFCPDGIAIPGYETKNPKPNELR